ncbi:hypothetical protein ACFFV7_51085 [Nonomuraea spiralis]|uniref:PD-(D/E)XK endonuclease-like domain-containing protein n=1 Tax=Nonomuraea spiralis TaxID=46182 RepID=A0ABV5IYI2_9ACTN|nr:hypothetical protein [Nonomuraea spiralis]GGS88309.1 hypothetical protein GCM10010176_035090 [Nonomuraea spiralis]
MNISQKVLDQQAELDALIEGHILNQPRSLQREPGPSELGIPCDLRLGYKLAGHPEVNANQTLPWKAWIGTNVHTGLEELLTRANMARPGWAADGVDRYLLEQRVTAGGVDGTDISGNSDLYVDGIVWDWKIPGGTTLRKYKKEGPGEQYEVQGHVYGLGHELAGRPVTDIVIYFLPRDQEWKQRFLWSAPYDRQRALDALSRADGIAKLVRALGPAAFPLLKRKASWCRSCPWLSPGSTDLARGCPGDPDVVDEAASDLLDLISQ